jgi:hypothetical protein
VEARAVEARTPDYMFTPELTRGVSGEIPLPQARVLQPARYRPARHGQHPRWRAAEMPSTSIHATARGVARIYSALACDGVLDGVRLLRPATIEQANAEVSAGRAGRTRATGT